MILSDGTLKKMIIKGSLGVSPIEDGQIQPASVDFTLGNTFSVIDPENGPVSRDKEVKYITQTTNRYVLMPGEFVLATTREYFKLPDDLTAFVEGRSSWGRLGLFVQNAGWVDPGFKGQITLELFNANRVPIILEEGTRLGQLVFAKMDQPAEHPYAGKYQGQTGATGSRMFKDYRYSA